MDKQALWFFLKSLRILMEKGLYDEAKELIEDLIKDMEKES